MHKIVIIGTYFGTWPEWLPAFLVSCKKNETVDWLFFTDCEIPDVDYPNMRFVPMRLEQLNHSASEKLGFRIAKRKYSQLDLRPAYGEIFEKYLTEYDFWGHCDFDVVWGDLRRFLTESTLNNHHIISSRKNALAGHFTLWRNEPRTNALFRAVPGYREAFSERRHLAFDEKIMSKFLGDLLSREKDSPIKIYWPIKMVVGWPELESKPRGWCWKNGRIFDRDNQEHMYVHFLTWKASMRNIDFRVGDEPESFSITRRGIWSSEPPLIERLMEASQLEARIMPLRRCLEQRRELAKSHVELAFDSHSLGKRQKAWSHAVRGLWYDPTWLRNRGLLSVAFQARFGHAPIALVRRLRGGQGEQD